MCGIVAWVGPGIDPEKLTAATNRLAHRGPDGMGSWSDGVAWLGHRRLSIIDLSDRGAQPMSNEDGQVYITFNGEIYNYPELRRDLESKGHVFKSDTDTEVIVHAYEEYGDECIGRLWGMFAFAIWDRRRRRLFVGCDRFGKKPVNFIHKGDRFALASEIPALLETGLSDRKIDREALGLFWELGYIPSPHTAFADIRRLPAGHAMVLEPGKSLRIWRYYPPYEVAPFTGSYEQAKEELSALLADATRRRLVSDVPVGIALSGGIDSAIVVAAARRLHSGRLITVTVRPHLDDDAHDEGDFARATARRFNTEHVEIRPTPNFVESFERTIGHIGQPFAVASIIPSYYLFEAMRRQVKVCISGDGGDELFAGYEHYQQIRAAARIRRLVPGIVPDAAQPVLNWIYGKVPASRSRLKVVMAGMQFILRDQPLCEPPWEHRRALQPNRRPRRGQATKLDRELRSLFVEKDPMRVQMLTEQFGRMSSHILTKVDISSMCHSVEVRSPLLAHRLAEFARSLPDEYLFESRRASNGRSHAGNRGKKILRDLYADELPPEVLGKPKSGFGIPIRDLFANELKPYLMERLTARQEVYDQLIRREKIPEIIESHCQGRPYQTGLLMKLLSVAIWLGQTGATLG